MSYGYGLKTCRETLLYLSSELDIEERMVKAFSEIGLINSKDVSQQHYKEIKVLRTKYLSLTELAVGNDGVLQIINKNKELAKLAQELVWLCVETIEHNSRNSTKHNLL